MAEKAGILRENLALKATSVEADSEVQNYPPIDVLNRRHDLPWRTSSPNATLSLEFDELISVDTVVIRIPSERTPELQPTILLAPTDTVTITARDGEDGPVVDTITAVTDHDPRWGYISILLPRAFAGSYWTFAFSASAGFFEVENLFLGQLWFPGFNYNRGATFGPLNDAEIGRAAFTGGTFSESRSRLFQFAASWSIWNQQELTEWEEFETEHGITKPFVFLRRTTGDLKRRVGIVNFSADPVLTDQDGVHFIIRAQFTENR